MYTGLATLYGWGPDTVDRLTIEEASMYLNGPPEDSSARRTLTAEEYRAMARAKG